MPRPLLHRIAIAKSASIGVLHLVAAFGASYALTADVAIAGAINLVEPAVNNVVHYFHDRRWGQLSAWWAQRRHALSMRAA